uniref:C3HC4 type zinc finger protein n=1 Tax=Pithovirus LCDPAC01 TaxID=2506600 RepID=A0A481YN81_9VIRU|nr:MAG: C3HC4 type zinc finger protein [Pithovirus LCDPAC01]
MGTTTSSDEEENVSNQYSFRGSGEMKTPLLNENIFEKIPESPSSESYEEPILLYEKTKEDKNIEKYADDIIRKLEDIKTDLINSRLFNSKCRGCGRESNVVFNPCGHVCICSICSEVILLCPICSENIVEKITFVRS